MLRMLHVLGHTGPRWATLGCALRLLTPQASHLTAQHSSSASPPLLAPAGRDLPPGAVRALSADERLVSLPQYQSLAAKVPAKQVNGWPCCFVPLEAAAAAWHASRQLAALTPAPHLTASTTVLHSLPLQRTEDRRVLVSYLPVSKGQWRWYRPSELEPFTGNTGEALLPSRASLS